MKVNGGSSTSTKFNVLLVAFLAKNSKLELTGPQPQVISSPTSALERLIHGMTTLSQYISPIRLKPMDLSWSGVTSIKLENKQNRCFVYPILLRFEQQNNEASLMSPKMEKSKNLNKYSFKLNESDTLRINIESRKSIKLKN